jgi:hypothetical protein
MNSLIKGIGYEERFDDYPGGGKLFKGLKVTVHFEHDGHQGRVLFDYPTAPNNINEIAEQVLKVALFGGLLPEGISDLSVKT